MGTQEKSVITVETTIAAAVDKVWEYWTKPEHITKWNSASEDWITPRAENDLRKGGSFNCRMEAKDGSMGFDFSGIYDDVIEHQLIAYTLGDQRKVEITFSTAGNSTNVTEKFDAETTNSVEMQKMGWQSILNNFKKYTEGDQ